MLTRLIDPIEFMSSTFSKLVPNLQPFSYQSRFLCDDSPRLIFKTGRQVGKTLVASAKALHFALNNSNVIVAIVSPTQRQSGFIFNYIRDTISANEALSGFLDSNTSTFLKFKNGSKIYSLPSGSAGVTIRGLGVNLLILDEAAYIKDAVFTAILRSVDATHGNVVLLSSPFGTRGKFYTAWNSPFYSKIAVSSFDCPNISKEAIQQELESGMMTENEYRQEILGEFVSDADSFFPREVVLNCMEEYAEVSETESAEASYDLGVDLARYGVDENVYTVSKFLPDGSAKVVRIEVTKKVPLSDAMGRIIDLDKRFNFGNIYIDETGLGAGVVDKVLEDKRIEFKIKPTTFTQENKETMYRNLKWLFENKKIAIPNNWNVSQKLLFQLTELQYKFSSNGHMSVHHPDNGHDDFPDSLALSVMRLRKKPSSFGLAGSSAR
jgi:phage FluMu gp28-like protein